MAVQFNIDAAIKYVFSVSRIVSTHPAVRSLKLGEEVGEFNEAINHALGNLPHKEMKEPLIGEAADVIQVVLDIVRVMHPDMGDDLLLQTLAQHLILKTDKWLAQVEGDPRSDHEKLMAKIDRFGCAETTPTEWRKIRSEISEDLKLLLK